MREIGIHSGKTIKNQRPAGKIPYVLKFMEIPASKFKWDHAVTHRHLP